MKLMTENNRNAFHIPCDCDKCLIFYEKQKPSLDEEKLYRIQHLIKEELTKAIENPNNIPFVDYHHGFGVMQEEFIELFKEVMTSKGKNTSNKKELRKEAIQVGAMAVRFLHDLFEVEL